MIILGLQFGHDGSVCIVKDGRILSYVYRERHSRIKHVIGITTKDIDMALEEAGVRVESIDFCAIISTQGTELLTGLIDNFSIRFAEHKGHIAPSPLVKLIKEHVGSVETTLSFGLKQAFQGEHQKDTLTYIAFSKMFAEKERLVKGELETVGWMDHYVMKEGWRSGATLDEIASRNAASLMQDQDIKYGFHYPVTVTFRGVGMPAYYVHHHMAHAASCFYRSRFDEAAIITHDGFGPGPGYNSGMILYGRGNEIVTISPHHLVIGLIYDHISFMLKLFTGGFDGAGKLMGLAPYGKPRFFHHGLVGNWFDSQKRYNGNQFFLWQQHCLAMAERLRYDLSALGQKERMTEPINADIAASTQKLFEECYLYAVHTTRTLFLNSGIQTDNLCLSGGTALNCPSNSRIFNEGVFSNIFIEPSCGDDGLAVGGALYIYHHLLQNPVVREPNEWYRSPYLGPEIREEDVQKALKAYGLQVRYEKRRDTAEQAAKDVHENKVIGWFEGRSESGPRALGHRSIVANPTHKGNWERVNRIKHREAWRPFAPSVLEEEARNWFKGVPHPSPYMLFNAQVCSSELPAITHVDGSSRIQTVGPEAGEYYKMVGAFHKISGVPVVLNTSFNGPGEPIVETPEQALALFVKSELDTLYLNGYRIIRAQ